MNKDSLNLMGFEVSRQQIPPNKNFSHQPDAFFVSDSLKEQIATEASSEKLVELQKNIIQVVVDLTSTQTALTLLAGILQDCSTTISSTGKTTIKIKSDLSEVIAVFTKFLNNEKFSIKAMVFNESNLSVSGDVETIQVVDIDYQTNLANIVLTFENRYNHEQL